MAGQKGQQPRETVRFQERLIRYMKTTRIKAHVHPCVGSARAVVRWRVGRVWGSGQSALQAADRSAWGQPLVLSRWRAAVRAAPRLPQPPAGLPTRWWTVGGSPELLALAGSQRYASLRSQSPDRPTQRRRGPWYAVWAPVRRWVVPGSSLGSQALLPAPHGLGNVLEQTLHLASPIAPQGARGRHRLRPCHHKVGIYWGAWGLCRPHTPARLPSLASRRASVTSR